MWWDNIIGQKKIINQLKYSIEHNRVPHSQIFVGESGYGLLALSIAFFSEILYRENIKNKLKLQEFMHLDLHFIFPTCKKINLDSLSIYFLKDWIKFIKKNLYGSLNDWYDVILNKDKEGLINIKEIEIIVQKIFLKSVEGGSKCIIIWMAHKMNIVASNKFLKLLEEPPKGTYFILLIDNLDLVLKTIISRCQIVTIPPIDDIAIYNKLNTRINNDNLITKLVYESNGNWNTTLLLLNRLDEYEHFEEYLIYWMRYAFQLKNNTQVLHKIYKLSLLLDQLGKEKQKRFLVYVLEMFRQAYIYNFDIESLKKLRLSKYNFNWEVFTEYIHKNNINLILDELSKCFYYIERNANSKILFLNMLITISRFLNIKI